MSLHDREKWEEKHAQAEATPVPAPHPSLAWLPKAAPGQRALDVACGRGRNTETLLELGYSVVCVDVARTALRAAVRALHGSVGDRLQPLQADLDDWPFRADAFDVIVQTDFLDRRLFSALETSTKNSGLILIDTFRRGHGSLPSSGPKCRDFVLEDGELARAFACWEILRSEEVDARAAVLARKPPALTRAPRSDTRTP